jgi:rod shape-determining protein MreC
LTILFERRPKWVSYIFVLLSLLLLSLSSGEGQEWNPAEKIAVEIAAPFQRLFTGTVSLVRDIWRNYFFLVQTRQENLLLKRRIDLLEIENSKYQELLLANQRLRNLLRFQENTNESLLAARVIGWDSSRLYKSIILDKGKSDGLTGKMAVVNSEGVVGRIVSISPNYAQALLITDQNSAIDGLVQSSRARGMLKGGGSGGCYFDYVIKTCEIETGDRIVTSGLGGIFPKGLSLGTVKEINDSPNMLFKEVRVIPAVDFSKLEEVLIVLSSGSVPVGGSDLQ